MTKLTIMAMAMVSVVVFAGDLHNNHEHDGEHAHEHECDHKHEHGHDHDHAHGKGVEVSAAAAKAMGLKTVRAEKRRMRSTLSLMGRLELAPDARRSEASPVAGRVALKVHPLQSVKAGEVLFSVEAPELRAKAKEIEILERRLKVYHELNRASAELEAQLALRRAERETLLAGAKEQNGVVTIRAATDGWIDALPVMDGAWVASGTAVVEIVRPEMTRFKALVATAEAARLRDGMKVVCGDETGTLKLGFADASGMTPVYATFETAVDNGRAGSMKPPESSSSGRAACPHAAANGDGRGCHPSTPRKIGERLRVDCVTDESESPVIAVPTACIVRVGLEPTVFVHDEHDEDRYLAVKVTPGRANGGWTEVAGLPDDDDLEIVKEGAYELKIALAAQAGTAPAGHFHADGTFHEGKDEH